MRGEAALLSRDRPIPEWARRAQKAALPEDDDVQIDPDTMERFQRLRAARAELARERQLPAYCVCHDRTLRQIARPDREHIHHRMLALGWSVRRTVLVLYAITAVLSVLALATADVQAP